jgi:3'(2'), 5'-bisphosphate nucleotidase
VVFPADDGLARDLAFAAGERLLKLRVSGQTADELRKAGDLGSQDFLAAELARNRPDDAVLSEEAVDDPARLTADRVWIIDPLDGTREFSTPGRDDWAVHVALWRSGAEITDAAVALPARGELYRSDTVSGPGPRAGAQRPIRVAVSASRPPSILWYLQRTIAIEPVSIGSAGAKAMAVVSGDVDAYLHAGGQWEWDSAAPAGVVLAAGLHASRLDGSPLRYNQLDPYLPDLLMCRSEVAGLLLDAVRRAVS